MSQYTLFYILTFRLIAVLSVHYIWILFDVPEAMLSRKKQPNFIQQYNLCNDTLTVLFKSAPLYHANNISTFRLICSSNSTLHLDDSFDALETMPARPQPSAYNKSSSLEAASSTTIQRPTTLPSSLSSPATTELTPTQRQKTQVGVTVIETVSPMVRDHSHDKTKIGGEIQ